jgi:tRNA/rRNA methyltransferase
VEVVFILVKPAVAENIGAAARAIKTMGFSQLRIVDSEQQRHKKARILAHGAGDVLNAVQSFDTLTAALADVDWTIATSAKARLGKRFSYGADELHGLVAAKAATLGRIAIVFGCEESGLSNSDLKLCDCLSYIPIAQPYPSLNLGQAVMIFAYSLRPLAQADDGAALAPIAAPEAADFAFLKRRLEALLGSLNLQREHKIHRWASERMAALASIDIKFLHLLLNKLEQSRDRE